MSIKIKQRKPYLVKEVGEWKFTFHYKEGSIEKTFLSITSASNIFNCRIGGNTEAYGYLLAAARQNVDSQLQGYAAMLFIPAMTMTQDQKLCDDIRAAIDGWMERKKTEAEVAAGTVSDTDEQAAQAFMEGVAEYADAESDKERKAVCERWKHELKEEIRYSEGQADDIQGD